MDNIEAYNRWANTYDSNLNKTRDLEGTALRKVLSTVSFNRVLEIGCGTGKNTVWLARKAEAVARADFSEKCLIRQRRK